MDTENSPTSTLSPATMTEIARSLKRKEQFVELGFVEKMIELWRLRRRICEAKAEIYVSGVLAKYTYQAAEAIMNKNYGL